jgi:CheY-like chemotaxis protein
MDGVALTYAIKQLRPNLPVVLVSSHLEPETEHAGEAFLAKPYQPRDLFKVVERFVGAEWQTRRSNPSAS